MTFLFNDEEIRNMHDNALKREVTEQVTQQVTEKGIGSLVKAIKGFALSRENAVKAVMEQYGLQPQEAIAKVAQYW